MSFLFIEWGRVKASNGEENDNVALQIAESVSATGTSNTRAMKNNDDDNVGKQARIRVHQ